MIKYNIGHYRTLRDGMFPHFLPSGKTGGETNQGDNLEWIETYDPKRNAHKEWTWLGSPDV